MATLTLGDMLDRAGDFEIRLETFYARVRDTARSDGVRLLTHYLSRHRDHLPAALQALSPAELRNIRRVGVKYDHTEFRSGNWPFEGVGIDRDIGSVEFLDIAIASVESLIEFYRWLAGLPLGPEAGDLVRSLLKIEETHVVELKKTKAMDYF